jgi:F-type H+-transporting ATPase subunit c
MNNLLKKTSVYLLMAMVVIFAVFAPVYAAASSAQETAAPPAAQAGQVADNDDSTSSKAMTAALAIGVVAAAGAIAMGMVISKSVESIARQPEAEGKIRTALLVGLVFIETAIIYALVVAIMIIFVL